MQSSPQRGPGGQYHPLSLLWGTELLLVSCTPQKRSARPHIPTKLGAWMGKSLSDT